MTTSGCTNVIPPAPPPLPPGIPKTAPNAYRSIQLTVIAENLPPSTRSVFDHALKAGNYRLYPQLARQPDGSEACVYWTAYNVNTKRNEFVVGPNQLDRFMNAPRDFENAAAAAYMNGEPNAWTRESMKTVDAAMRCGPTSKEVGSHLAASWLEAVKDPEWWMQNAAGAAGAIAESGAAAQRRINNPPAAQLGKNSPIVEGGGLAAHEGGPANAHTIGKHVGKSEAELRARLAAEPEKDAVSTFKDRTSAELAATRTLEANDARIAEWLDKGKPKSRLVLNQPGPSGGVVLERGADGPVPGTSTRIVLVKDASKNCGFRILTGFPTLD